MDCLHVHTEMRRYFCLIMWRGDMALSEATERLLDGAQRWADTSLSWTQTVSTSWEPNGLRDAQYQYILRTVRFGHADNWYLWNRWERCGGKKKTAEVHYQRWCVRKGGFRMWRRVTRRALRFSPGSPCSVGAVACGASALLARAGSGKCPGGNKKSGSCETTSQRCRFGAPRLLLT